MMDLPPRSDCVSWQIVLRLYSILPIDLTFLQDLGDVREFSLIVC